MRASVRSVPMCDRAVRMLMQYCMATLRPSSRAPHKKAADQQSNNGSYDYPSSNTGEVEGPAESTPLRGE
jgi:hypothetical protein